MGFTLIERYVFKKAAYAVAIAVAGLVAVLWITRAVQEVDILLNKGQGILTYLKMTSLGVPTLTAAIVPMALLIGLIQTINGLNKDSELVVIHASGASRSVLLKPFVALGLLASVIVLTLHLWAAPLSMQTLRNYISKVRADLVSVIVQEGKFQNVGKGIVVHIASRAPGGLLKGIFIHDNRDPRYALTYMARDGSVLEIEDRAYLLLEEGQIHRRDVKNGDLSIIKYNSYAFNLTTLTPGRTGSISSQMELNTLDLLFPDKEDPFYKSYPGRFQAELHTRLTGGLYPILVVLSLLTFIGNPSSHRQGQVIVIIVACASIVGLRGLTIFGEGALRTNSSMLYLVWGLPLAYIATSIFLLATDRSALPAEWLAKIETGLFRLSDALEPVRMRIFGQRLTSEQPA